MSEDVVAGIVRCNLIVEMSRVFKVEEEVPVLIATPQICLLVS